MINPNLAIDASSLVSLQASTEKAQLKRAGAAQDFEALLIGQMLRSVREEGSGWLGTGDDQASSSAFGLGEEQLGRALTKGGGLGLARVIEAGLKKQADAPPIQDK
jgi:Rod binding domain-containing protein